MYFLAEINQNTHTHGRLLRQRGLHRGRSGQHVETFLIGDVLDLAPLPVWVQVRVRALGFIIELFCSSHIL